MHLSEHSCCEDEEIISLAVSSAHISSPLVVFLNPRYDITLADVSRDVTGIISDVIITIISDVTGIIINVIIIISNNNKNTRTNITFIFFC